MANQEQNIEAVVSKTERSKSVQGLLDKLNPNGYLKEHYTLEELMPPRMGSWNGLVRECRCHIDPPCQQCIDWSNACEERMEIVEAKIEPGCTIIEHGCSADGVA